MGYGRIWAEIDLGKLVDNYRKVKSLCPKSRVLAPIKADAYGHGAIEVARTLERVGIFMFGVAGVAEGIELRKAGIRTPILVLSPIPFEEIDAIFEYRLRPTISDPAFFDMLEEKLRFRRNRKLAVHVEVDTGMTRTGVSYDQAFTMIPWIAGKRNLELEGVFTHFPVADTSVPFSEKQVQALARLKKHLAGQGIRPKLFHIANTAGLVNRLGGPFSLARPGVALYGLMPANQMRDRLGLDPVMVLKTMVVNVRDVPRNAAISYGHTFRTKKRSKIATLSVGYGDGYPRCLSNIGEVIIRGRRARIVGTVCMDLMMVDVSGIADVGVNDTAILIGREGRAEITAAELALKAKTVIYEIICGIGPRVPRVYYQHGRFLRVRNLFLRGMM